MAKIEFPDDLKLATWKSKKGALPADSDPVTRLTTLKTKYDAVDWKPFADGGASAAEDVTALDDALAELEALWKSKVVPLNTHAAAVTKALKTPTDGKKASADCSRTLTKALGDFDGEIDAGPAALQQAASAVRSTLAAKALRESKAKQETNPVADLLGGGLQALMDEAARIPGA